MSVRKSLIFMYHYFQLQHWALHPVNKEYWLREFTPFEKLIQSMGEVSENADTEVC